MVIISGLHTPVSGLVSNFLLIAELVTNLIKDDFLLSLKILAVKGFRLWL